jgi:hypothetical protein
MIMGLSFRKKLRSDLKSELLSVRTYRICDSWIPQLLLWAYICLVSIQH